MAWYARAVEREQGLPATRMTVNHLQGCLKDINDLLTEQTQFHQTTSRKYKDIEHRLHAICMGLLVLTFLAGLVHFFHLVEAEGMLTFFCGFFPALGAALEGISNQGEFRRIGMRSESMAKALEQLIKQSVKLQSELDNGWNSSDIPISMQLAALANEAARLMVMEVLDWRVVFLDRSLNPAP